MDEITKEFTRYCPRPILGPRNQRNPRLFYLRIQTRKLGREVIKAAIHKGLEKAIREWEKDDGG